MERNYVTVTLCIVESVSGIFLIGEYLAKLQARKWLSPALRLLAVWWPGAQNARYINVLQGSVATNARCGGVFYNHFTADFPRNPPMTKIWKLVKMWQNYSREIVVSLLAHCVFAHSVNQPWQVKKPEKKHALKAPPHASAQVLNTTYAGKLLL